MQGLAAIRRRPWFVLGAVGLLAAQTACSLVQAPEGPVDDRGRVERLVQAGRHAEAAQGYADLAAASPPDHDYYELQSADQWVAAANIPEAQRALAGVSPDARTKLPILRALVTAELALAENDATRALHELDQITAPTEPREAQSYWSLRGKAAFLAGRSAEGVRAYVERERWLPDAASIRASRQELYAKVRAAAERGPLKPPAKPDPIVSGWLELGPVSVELARNPMHAAADLAAWKQRFPQHPAIDSVLAGAQSEIATSTTYPAEIALLLPLTGRVEPYGVAVRDGFIAAYLEQDPATRPHLRVYDVAAQPVASAYNQAITDGANFVVGPLTKEDVAAIAPLTAGRVPVLALNFLGDTTASARNLYQFALLPEDEARIVARRVVADGRSNGVAIVPEGELGDRVSAAFADELARLGGTLLASQRYESQRADFSDLIKQVLQVHTVKGEPSTHRADAQFMFIAGNASAARQIMSQLKFHYAGDVPVYATSDSFEPDPNANSDVDGMLFPDMPWMVSSDPVTAQIRDSVRSAWPARTTRRDRYYAFGFDAYRLVPLIRGRASGAEDAIDGVTGRLRLDDHNRVRRDLEWAQIKNGIPIDY
jgi:outer membrane PBP1 activator LpoA protein